MSKTTPRQKKIEGKAMEKWEVIRTQAFTTHPPGAGMCTLHVLAPV